MQDINLSKQHREDLIALCESLKTKSPEDAVSINNIIQFIRDQKYGLLFEKHQEQVDVDLLTKIPIFVEDKNKKISLKQTDLSEQDLTTHKHTQTHTQETPHSAQYNFLLEGDNLHSLKLLEKTHKGAIDVIYIDPPYNTGNKDFKYNDRYVNKDDGYQHSKWLSFMEERLAIAHTLLTSDGLLFISIDDSELYNLKLLCDNIFDESNFVTTICVELSKTQGMKVRSAQNGTIVKNHEYILVYCKDILNATTNRCPLYDKAEPYDDHFKLILNDDMTTTPLIDYIKQSKYAKEFTKYNLKLTIKNIGKLMQLSDDFNNFMINEISNKLYRLSMISSDEIQSMNLPIDKIVKHGQYLLMKNSKGTVEQLQSYQDTLHTTDEYVPEYCRATIRGALWKGFYSDMMNVSKEGDVEFKNGKKPKRLIKQLLKYVNRPNAIVLDFFAGSGTTGHAVLELNEEDKGNRRFILCTNNEANICEEITYQRLKTVITGVRSDGSKYSDGIPANLKYFRAEMIERNDENLDEKLLDASIPLIELENFEDIEDKNSSVFIAYSDEDLDEFEENFDKENNLVKTIYVAEDVCLSETQEQLFAFNDIKVKTIPNNFFREL